jgi:hypothetical protein
MLLKKILFLALFLSFSMFSQTPDTLNKNVLKTGNLDQQFEYVIQKSNNFQEYKVVKKEHLTYLKKGVVDSISKYKKTIIELESLQNENSSKISSLEQEIAQFESAIREVTEEKDQMDFFGVSLHKTIYSIFVYGIIGFLLFVLVLFFIRMRSALQNSNGATTALAKIESEFEEYKKRAMEKEQILGRKLQDEINKQKKTKK